MNGNNNNNNPLTTSYNRDYDNYEIQDMFTPEKIIDGFMIVSTHNVEIDPYPHLLEDVEPLPESLREYNLSPQEWTQFRKTLLGIQKQSKCCQWFGIIIFGIFAFSISILLPGRHCRSNCRGMIELTDYMDEDTATAILAFMVSMLLLGVILGKCSPCITQQCGMKWVCQTTDLSSSNSNLMVRHCYGEPRGGREDTRHFWIEFYIPSKFVVPPASSHLQEQQNQQSQHQQINNASNNDVMSTNGEIV